MSDIKMRFVQSGCKLRIRSAFLIGFIAAAASAATSPGVPPVDPLDPLDPLAQPAVPRVGTKAPVLIAAARADGRIVVAGESGTILFSDDQGKSWQQAKVPVSVTITGLCFPTAQKGWAAGHSGVILATTDGGTNWRLQRDGLMPITPEPSAQPMAPTAASGAGDPFLDVYFTDEANGFAVGAFGLILRTRDGGKSWIDWRRHLPNPDGNHLYGIRAVGNDLFIVGERGSIFVSADGGESFTAVKSPYEGSFFGLSAIPGGGVLVFGLRGHAFLSLDRGKTWNETKVGSGNAWLGASVLDDQRIVMVSQAGEVALSSDGGADFTLLPSHLPPLTAVVGSGHGTIVAAGMQGAKLLQLPATTARNELHD